MSQHVKGDVVESGHLLRFVEEKSKLGSGQKSLVGVLEEPSGRLRADKLLQVVLEHGVTGLTP